MMIRNNAFENIVKQVKQKRMLKRVIALLSVAVLLVTFNSTKFKADTLEHFTDCGYDYDHQHGSECYDMDGNLTCTLHVHTDACYQTRPTSDVQDEADSYPATKSSTEDAAEALADLPVEEVVSEPVVEAVSEPLEESVEEVEVQLGGDEEAAYVEYEDFEMESRNYELEPEALPLYYVGEQYPFFLSDVLSACGLEIPLSDVVDIGQVLSADDVPQTISFERIENDYAIYPTQDCEDQELAIITMTGFATVRLIEAVVPEWAKASVQVPEETGEEVNTKAAGEEKAGEIQKAEEIVEEAKGEPVEEIEEAEAATEPVEVTENEKGEPVEEIEEVAEPEKVEEDEKAEVVVEHTELEEATETKEAVVETAEPVEETQEKEVVEETAEPEEETQAKEAVEEAAKPEDATEVKEAVVEITEPEEEKTEAAEDSKETEEPEKDDETETEKTVETEETEEIEEVEKAEESEEAPAEPVATETGISENRTLIIDLAQVERYPLSLNAMLERFRPETVSRTEPAEALEESAPVEEASDEMAVEEEVVEDIEVESEAVEASVDEVEFELGEEPVADDEIEVVDIVEKAALPHIEYDDTLLSVENTGNDYLITPVASFDHTDIVVDDTWTILLLNSRVEVVVAMPAQSFEESTENVIVKVEAGEGAFPAGTTMSLEEIDDVNTLTGISDAAAAEDFVEVQRVHAVDITFRDADGNEIEPLIPISVVMSIRETEQDEDTTVVHVDNAGNAEVVEDAVSATEEVLITEAPIESVSFVSDAFSVYAVVVTKKLETKLITAGEETYKITVTYTEDAAIPEGATLEVREIEGDEAQAYLNQAGDAVERRIALARFFDIKIMDGDTEIQPAVPVTVSVELVNDEVAGLTDATPCAVHFTGEEADVVQVSETDETITFTAEGFSVWGVVYTVDFGYSVNGKMYQFSLPGGGFVSFTDLVEVLGITGDASSAENEAQTEEQITDGMLDVTASDAAKQFLADVASVAFSSPELVDVSKAENETTVGQIKESRGLECEYSADLTEDQIAKINSTKVESGDWALISMQPFDTEETLTVTMRNGEVFTIRVTDAQIHTTYKTASGDTYEITITYGAEAEIPDGATLEVSEIEVGTAEWQNYYAQAAEASGNGALAFARFFDIRIMNGETEIEPQAPVTTTIEYDSAIPLNPESCPKAIHFAEDGIEVLDVDMDDDEFASKFTFEQGSFSVTGTTVSELADGQYLIIGYNVDYNGNTYHDKSYTQNENWAYKGVTGFSASYRALQYYRSLGMNTDMSGGYGRPRYTGYYDSRVLWTVTKSGDGYLISNNGNYLRNNNGSLTTTTYANQASVWTYSNGQLRNGNHYLWFNGSTFSLTTAQPTGENIYFVWNNSSTSGNITIHYMLDNGNGTYTETSTATKSLQDNSLAKGDQYDLRSGIPSGMQYQKTVLSGNSAFDGSGTEIHYFLQTNTGLTDSDLPAIGYHGWLYRETTDWNFDYGVSGWPSNGGIAVSSVSAYRTFGDEKDIYVIYRQPPASSGTVNPDDVDAEEPRIEKNKVTNTNDDGSSDGTYDLSLSVTGSAKSASATSRANVAVVLDLSYSMLQQDTGTTGESRLDACKAAIESLANQLFALNTANPGTIEAAYIGFAQRVLNEREINNTYFDKASFMAAVNKSTTAAGTNWDAALEAVNNIQWSDGDPVYVIFVTDGQPNGFSNRNIAGNGNSYANYWDSGNYAINSTSDTSGSVLSPAAQITALQNSGVTVYGIGAWFGGTDAYYLNDINIPAANVSRANNTTQLNEQMAKIVSTIASSVGYENIQVTDGITGLTSTALVKGAVDNFRYEVAKYNFDSNGKKTSKIEGTEATVTVNNNGTITIAFPDGSTDTVNQAGYAESSNEVTWNLGTNYQLRDGYTYTVSFTVWPSQVAYDLLADLNNGICSWVDAAGTEPAKIVYDESVDDSVLPISGQRVYGKEYTDQIQKSGNAYSIKTNVETGNTVKYTKVKTVTQDGNTTTTREEGESNFINPDPMPLESTKLGLEKKWEDTTDNTQRPKSVNLDLYMGTKVYLNDLTLSNDNNWTMSDTLTIAPGLMVSTGHNAYNSAWPQVTYEGVTYAILDTGHDYYFAEDPMDYHFELTNYTYHPMIINGELWNVSFTYDEHGDITGVELIDKMTNISATNTLKGRLYVTKAVEIPEGAIGYDLKATTFPITITLKDKDGNPIVGEGAATEEKPNANGIMYRIQYGKNHPHTDEGWQAWSEEYQNCGRSSQKTFTDGTIEENIYAGDTIYVGNLPTGVTYEVTEGTLSTGWKLIEITYDDETKEIAGNDKDQVTVKNTLPSFTVGILKTRQDGTTALEGAKFDLYGSDYYTVDSSGASTVNSEAAALKEGLTSGPDGTFDLGFLAGGTYYLVETSAPVGYIRLAKPVIITVDGTSEEKKDDYPLYVTYVQDGQTLSISKEGVTITTETDGDGNVTYIYHLTVVNNEGVKLPATGGPGTNLIYFIGITMILLAGVGLVILKSRKDAA